MKMYNLCDRFFTSPPIKPVMSKTGLKWKIQSEFMVTRLTSGHFCFISGPHLCTINRSQNICFLKNLDLWRGPPILVESNVYPGSFQWPVYECQIQKCFLKRVPRRSLRTNGGHIYKVKQDWDITLNTPCVPFCLGTLIKVVHTFW